MRFSLDAAAGWAGSLSRLWWGVGVLGASLLVSGLTLGAARTTAPAAPAEPEEERPPLRRVA